MPQVFRNLFQGIGIFHSGIDNSYLDTQSKLQRPDIGVLKESCDRWVWIFFLLEEES